MDAFSAAIVAAQTVAYALSIIKSLTELRNALKDGRCFLDNEQARIGHLQDILLQLVPKDKKGLDPGLDSILQSICAAVESLLLLFRRRNRIHLVLLLIVRRAEVNESFASLERQKNTLTLYLMAQNSDVLASLQDHILPRSKPTLKMPQHSHSSSLDSAYASVNREAQEDPTTSSNDALTSTAQEPSPQTHGAEHNSDKMRTPTNRNGTGGTEFSTSECGAKGKSTQEIYGPNQVGMKSTHAKNTAQDDAHQSIGMDPSTFRPTRG